MSDVVTDPIVRTEALDCDRKRCAWRRPRYVVGAWVEMVPGDALTRVVLGDTVADALERGRERSEGR